MLSCGAALGGDLVINGGFEDPAVPDDDLDGGLLFTAPTILPGDWSLVAGSVDILRRSGSTPFQTPEGSQAIDLTGMGSRGTIRRTLDATDYAVYRLTFWIAGNPTCEPGVKRVTVTVENTIFASLMFNTTGRTPANMGWTGYEYTFQGVSEPRFLQFQSTTGTNCGIMLDGVALEKCLEVIGQPLNQSRCEGTHAIFSIATTGDSVQYRWRRGGTNLSDGNGVSGAHSPTLVIDPVEAGDAGVYSCQVFNLCGELISANAVLTVVPPACPGDANGDLLVDFSDITRILDFWNANYAPGTGPGDSDCDGLVDFLEITQVLSNWGSACP